jgi:hypothetical protein
MSERAQCRPRSVDAAAGRAEVMAAWPSSSAGGRPGGGSASGAPRAGQAPVGWLSTASSVARRLALLAIAGRRRRGRVAAKGPEPTPQMSAPRVSDRVGRCGGRAYRVVIGRAGDAGADDPPGQPERLGDQVRAGMFSQRAVSARRPRPRRNRVGQCHDLVASSASVRSAPADAAAGSGSRRISSPSPRRRRH